MLCNSFGANEASQSFQTLQPQGAARKEGLSASWSQPSQLMATA